MNQTRHITAKEAREKAMQWCSRREYCRKDVVDKAVSWGCTPDEARELTAYLVEQGFVNERRYAEAFARDKLRFNKWGRVKIAYMLRVQAIDQTLSADVLSTIDEAEYLQILTGELQKKHKSTKGTAFEIKGKLFRFAVGRGFEPEIVQEIISKF